MSRNGALSRCEKRKCKCTKDKGQDQEKVRNQKMKKMACEYEKFLTKDSKSLLKKYLTRDVYERIKENFTRLNGTLLDCAQSGLTHPESNVGLYACDQHAYKVFAELFDAVISDYHVGFCKNDVHPPSNWGDPAKLPSIDPESKYVISTRVRCARSVCGYPFCPLMTEQDYLEIQEKLKCAFRTKQAELNCEYYGLDKMTEEQRQQLVADHFLFRNDDKILEDANAYQFWPKGRGIFHNPEKKLLAWCCEEDHLRLISMEKGNDLRGVYGRLKNAIGVLESQVQFSHDDRLGYLTFCPTNLGTTIRASVHIKLPKLAKDMDNFKNIAKQYSLQVRGTGGEHTESVGGVYDVSNIRRLGLTEFEVLMEMSQGLNKLIQEEEKL
ncbi:hypothetical protein TKK_0010347 [Trichogramma kaykai]|uniref:arginine kinase n=1 Tax=Trichogramma kaykai TaxID=54128 RepID=A0ABD2WXB8_9HYME